MKSSIPAPSSPLDLKGGYEFFPALTEARKLHKADAIIQ